jgi:hypothetical protein
MKVRHTTHGTVVQVPKELEDWTPDRAGINPELAAKGKPQPTPWFKWAQWEPVDDSTPLTPPPAPKDAPAAESKTAAKGKAD